jgi:hypothetical protein
MVPGYGDSEDEANCTRQLKIFLIIKKKKTWLRTIAIVRRTIMIFQNIYKLHMTEWKLAISRVTLETCTCAIECIQNGSHAVTRIEVWASNAVNYIFHRFIWIAHKLDSDILHKTMQLCKLQINCIRLPITLSSGQIFLERWEENSIIIIKHLKLWYMGS